MSTAFQPAGFGPEFAVPCEIVAALIDTGFTDSSWGNDACPSWIDDCRGNAGVRVWVDALEPADREPCPCPDHARRFVIVDEEHGEDLLTTEDPAVLLEWLRNERRIDTLLTRLRNDLRKGVQS